MRHKIVIVEDKGKFFIEAFISDEGKNWEKVDALSSGILEGNFLLKAQNALKRDFLRKSR